jgi:hypothetical protein
MDLGKSIRFKEGEDFGLVFRLFAAPEERPHLLASVSFRRVAFERTGRFFGEWDVGLAQGATEASIRGGSSAKKVLADAFARGKGRALGRIGAGLWTAPLFFGGVKDEGEGGGGQGRDNEAGVFHAGRMMAENAPCKRESGGLSAPRKGTG